jgi:RNA-binding protein YhbY
MAGRDLVKIKALDTCPEDIAGVAARLADALGGTVVSTAGRTALLYRPNPELPADKGHPS